MHATFYSTDGETYDPALSEGLHYYMKYSDCSVCRTHPEFNGRKAGAAALCNAFKANAGCSKT